MVIYPCNNTWNYTLPVCLQIARTELLAGSSHGSELNSDVSWGDLEPTATRHGEKHLSRLYSYISICIP